MSQLIVDFIATHGTLSEEEAFARFVGQEPIASWVKGDGHRRERIRREFRLAWRQREASGAASHRTLEVNAQAEAAPREEASGLAAPSPEMPRALSLLCTACMRLDVWSRGRLVECRSCGRVYHDLLDLVPVRRVGPFAYVFGAGSKGVATAAGLTLLLVAIYGAFRWL